jgi:hypothetical protein
MLFKKIGRRKRMGKTGKTGETVNKGLKVKVVKNEKKTLKPITECSKDKKVKLSSKVIPLKKLSDKALTECSKVKKTKITAQINCPTNSPINSDETVKVVESVVKTNNGYKSKKISTECIDTSKLKVLKFLGWCPSDGCTCSITSADLIGKDLYKCIRCGNKCLSTELLKEEKKGRERLSLRERNECLEEMSEGISFHDEPDIPETFKDIDLGEDWD